MMIMAGWGYLLLLALLTGVYLLFLRRVRQGLRYLQAQSPPPDPESWPNVAILIPARDEADRIEACLASVCAQTWPKENLRIVVIDDHSRDDTAARARALLDGDPRGLVLSSDAPPGKKSALTLGVHAVEADLILTTDADCRHHPDWIRTLAAPLLSGADVVAGPVLYTDRSTWFARVQALEFLGLVAVGAGLMGVGWPRLCNGANLGYRRERFFEAGGYTGNLSIASGDDEFLMQRIVYRHGGRAEFVPFPAAVVTTDPAPTLTTFLRQRMRWASKGGRYENGAFVSFLTLLFAYFLQLLLIPFLALGGGPLLGAGMILLGAKWIADFAVLFSAARLFRSPVRLVDVLSAELLHAPYLVLVSTLGTLWSVSWKEQERS